MRPMRIVVIGGSGFVGSRLIPRLRASGHFVRIADLAVSELFPELSVACDVRDFESVRRACEGMDVIYNLAAVHRDDVRPRSLYHQVNVEGAKHVCQAAEQCGIRRLIFTSSVAVYGLPDREVDESAAPKPFNEYGRTKLLAEAVYQDWVRQSADRSLAILRPTVIFGEGNRGNFYNLIKQIQSGRFVMIGNGRNRKSIAYVENVAAFLVFLLELDSGQHLFNYADKPDFDMNRLVALVRTAQGRTNAGQLRLPFAMGYAAGLLCDAASLLLRRNLPVSAIRIRKFCASTVFSAANAFATGFVPPVDLGEAVNRTIRRECDRSSAPITAPGELFTKVESC